MLKLNFWWVAVLLVAAFAFSSCEKSEILNEVAEEQPSLKVIVSPGPIEGVEYFTDLLEAETCGEIKITPIFDAQNQEAGLVKISNDDENLYIEIETNENWKFLMANLYIGSYENIPLSSSGEPNTRSFPIQVRFTALLSYVVFSIPLENFNDEFVVAPMIYGFKYNNGTLVSRQYIWGGDNLIGNSQIARYSNYSVQSCCEIIPFSYDLITQKDKDIGDLTVVNDEEYLYVTYTLTNDWYVKNIKMFVGDVNDLPMNHGGNPVVGHFPIKEHFASGTTTFTYTFNVSELPDCLVIAVFSSNEKIVNGVKVDSGSAWSYGTEFSAKKRWGWYSEYCMQFCN